MARKYRKKVLLAKIEAVYGTDAAPTGAANAILTQGLSIQTMQGPTANREVDRPQLGNDITYHVGPHTVVTFKVEAAGAGAAGTAPAYGPLLRACGFAETIDLTVGLENVSYSLVSGNEESVTLYVNIDGINHKILGARGSVKPSMDPGGIPYLEFTLTGLRVAPADTALPAADFSAFQNPLAVNDAHTPTFSLHGYAGTLIACQIDQANEVKYRNVVGEESVQIVDRAPNGSITIEEPLLATKDFHAIIDAHTTGAFQLVHGTTAGSIFQLDAPAAQLLQPQSGETDGIATLAMKMNIVPVAGDDEMTITVK